jgi:hypothetical protein
VVDGEELSGIMALAFGKLLSRQAWDTHGPLAQLVEQLTLNQWVQGSSPWRIIFLLTLTDISGFPPFGGTLQGSSPWRIIFLLILPDISGFSLFGVRGHFSFKDHRLSMGLTHEGGLQGSKLTLESGFYWYKSW